MFLLEVIRHTWSYCCNKQKKYATQNEVVDPFIGQYKNKST